MNARIQALVNQHLLNQSLIQAEYEEALRVFIEDVQGMTIEEIRGETQRAAFEKLRARCSVLYTEHRLTADLLRLLVPAPDPQAAPVAQEPETSEVVHREAAE